MKRGTIWKISEMKVFYIYHEKLAYSTWLNPWLLSFSWVAWHTTHGRGCGNQSKSEYWKWELNYSLFRISFIDLKENVRESKIRGQIKKILQDKSGVRFSQSHALSRVNYLFGFTDNVYHSEQITPRQIKSGGRLSCQRFRFSLTSGIKENA